MKHRMNGMIRKDNSQGLSVQEKNLYQTIVKEWHQVESEIHSARKDS